MNPKKIRVAVVGAGWWGHNHARVFSSRTDTELCAIAGRSEAKTRERADLFKVPYYLNIPEMLEKQKPDFVSLCLPGLQTFAPTMQVIEAGVPLLVEKPLAYDLQQAESLVREAQKRNLFFAINFNHRYGKPVQLARQDILAGNLGELVFSIWRFGHGSGPTLNHEHVNLIEAQCHGFDMLEFLCGSINSVMAEMTGKTNKGSYSTFVVSLVFENGSLGSFTGSFDSAEEYPQSQFLEINGTKGRVLIEDNVKKYTFNEAGSETGKTWQAGFFNDKDRMFGGNFDKHAEQLMTAFKAGDQPPIPASRGLRALQIAHAVIDSFQQGKRIAIPRDPFPM